MKYFFTFYQLYVILLVMDLEQLTIFVVRPTLGILELGSKGAERLVAGTGLVESGLNMISQVPSGIAKGVYQMEQVTHDDIWDTYLRYPAQKDLALKVGSLTMVNTNITKFNELAGNLYYATAMCRIKYKRAPMKLPDGESLEELAAYWKNNYNTAGGAGTIDDFMNKAKDVMKL